MDGRERKLKEIQEIFFWNKLNGQLLHLKRRGKPLQNHYHNKLQEFCFDNLLHSKITSNPFLLEIPLSLVTDFQQTFIITHNTRSWTKRLSELLPETYTLNIVKALAETFTSVAKYNREHKLVKDIGSEEDSDEDLNEFLDAYLEAKEEKGIDIAPLTHDLHRLKGTALREIMKIFDCREYLKIGDNLIYLDFGGHGRGNIDVLRAKELYMRRYLAEAYSIVGKRSDVKWVSEKKEIIWMLKEKLKGEGLKKSIKSFVRHEIEMCTAEINMMYSFRKSISRMRNTGFNKIIIANTQPFFFIDYPLPLEQ